MLCGPDDPYHIVAIKRGHETIIPGGNDELKSLDLAYFMTTKQYIPYIRHITGKDHYVDVRNVMIMGGGMTAVRALENMPEYMNAKIIEINPERCQELDQFIDSKTLVIKGMPATPHCSKTRASRTPKPSSRLPAMPRPTFWPASPPSASA